MVQLLLKDAVTSLHSSLVVNTVSVQVFSFFFWGLSLSRPLIAVQYSRSRDIQYNLYTTRGIRDLQVVLQLRK